MPGDKPTSVQRTIMQKMADGWKLHYVAGIRRGPSAFISGENHGEHLRVRVDYLEKLKDKGWVEMCSDPRWAWRSSQYALTEQGKAVLAGAGRNHERHTSKGRGQGKIFHMKRWPPMRAGA